MSTRKAHLALGTLVVLALAVVTATASASSSSTTEVLPAQEVELFLEPAAICEPAKSASAKSCSGDISNAFCHYCDLDLCGCVWVPNCTLVFECACSDVGCFRQCKNVNCVT